MVLGPDESRTIRGMSWWAIGTGLMGISHGKTLAGAGVLIGAAFASNYWRKPEFGWRRTIDMIWVQILLWPHLFYAWWSPVRGTYYAISAAGALAYLISWEFLKRGETRKSMVMHMIVTACANLSLAVLYSYPLLT